MSDAYLQGQGNGTGLKVRNFKAVFSTQIRMALPTLRRWDATLFYLDLHCGSGHNEKAQCIGSPLAFVQQARELDVARVRALCVDFNPRAIDELRGRLAALRLPPTYQVAAECMNNDEAFERFRPWITDRPRYALGIVTCDPNGCIDAAPRPVTKGHGSVPFWPLVEFCRVFERFDVILNANVRQKRQWQGAQRAGHPAALRRFVPELDELPRLLSRRAGFVQEHHGKEPFVTVLCTNARRGEHFKLGLYAMTSPEGHAILARTRLKPRLQEVAV